ncbi:MAG: DNA adenine methylase [Bacteroidetes bacterium]|nr:DNA adenine methylase [Bacteroidota bacterium]
MENKLENSQFESPLRYPGGKSCIFPFMSKLFYENNLIGTNYAEPYAGGSGLALKLLYNEFVDKIFINDLDNSIYTFWKVVLNQNLRFCDWIEDLDINVENWTYYKQVLQSTNIMNSEFELAKAVFFLNRTNISGVIQGGIIGGKNQTGKYKIDARFNKNDLIKRIRRIELFRRRIFVSNLDGINFIKKINKKQEDFFIYLDPPYFQKGADLYMNFYSKKDHKKLAKNVDLINKKWLISYDNHEFILNLYPAHKKVIYRLSQSASNRIGDEILIFSDKVKFKNSTTKLNNALII